MRNLLPKSLVILGVPSLTPFQKMHEIYHCISDGEFNFVRNETVIA